MAIDRLIVIGASSGGTEALTRVIGSFPRHLVAAVCVVRHTAAESPAVLDRILAGAGVLTASMARHGERLRPGHVFVAPPDHHLLVEPGQLCLSRGPRENRFRPAIDPLFRSAAQVYGPRVIGCVLTGNLDDGAAGLWAIRQLGGVAVVQDPSDALYPSMPLNALRRVPDAHTARLDDIGPLLAQLLATSVHATSVEAPPPHLEVEVRIAKDEPPLRAGLLGLGEPSRYTCPECHGTLLALKEGDQVRYRCHTGHAYSVESLLAAVSESIDEALGGAERALQEGELLVRELGDELDPDFDRDRIARIRGQADQAARQAQVVRDLLSDRAAFVAARGD
jgi:two-component system, chemotaxis family, protein-glutamate methylesterase/glutaminase